MYPNFEAMWADRCAKTNKVYTLVDFPRQRSIYDLLARSLDLPGDIAEVGVYKGGTAATILTTAAHTNKTTYLFDTFTGLPAPTEFDTHKQGDFDDTSLEQVTESLKEFPNKYLLKGFFPTVLREQTQVHNIYDTRFCFVHIDVDLYQCVRDCLEFFWPRLVPGGVLVSDDYEWHGTPGATKALDEFFGKANLRQNTPIQCYMIKQEPQ